MKKIVHIVHCDKFTNGYINYMNYKIVDYCHYFLYLKNDKYEINEEKNVIKLDNKKELFLKENINLLEDADLIIVSGIFEIYKSVYRLPKKILNKMLLQFWGGDFYGYRKTKIFSINQINKIKMKYMINNSKGIINLIENDYLELCKIFPNNKPHFVAPVPRDPQKEINYEVFLLKNRDSRNIIIGNSATQENYHVKILQDLAHLKNENINIFCPLSYGDKEYADKVIAEGKNIFGNKFTGITNFMKYEEYIEFLSMCSIGIFNNDRQQGMGNINTLLKMGKKIYLRKNTSMWEHYMNNNIKIYPIDDLSSISYQELYKFDEMYSYANHKNMKKRDEVSEKLWEKLLKQLK